MALLMGLRTISPAGLQELLARDAALVIDVNSPASWAQTRVPGARNLDPTTFEPDELPGDRAGLVVFYCSNPLCRKAPNAAKRARRLGYENVRVMSAGIKGWVGAGLPVEQGVPAPR